MKMNVYFKVLDEVTYPIYQALREERCANIRCWLNSSDRAARHILARDIDLIDFNETDNNLYCLDWDIGCLSVTPHGLLNLTPHYDGLQHLVERSLKQKLKFVCIDNCAHPKQQLVLFQDAPHLPEYPKQFIKIDCFNSYNDLIKYASEHGVFELTLTDTQRFERLTGEHQVKGATIYRDLNTGYLWYLDTFHKTHYEVFDREGKKHLGEADLSGNLDRTKADSKKHITL